MNGTGGRRATIEAAALELFAERGFVGTGIRDIARRAGLVSSALYHYVGTKEELLASIMRRGVTSAIKVATLALDGIQLPECQVATLVQMHVAMQLHDPRTSNVVDGEVDRLEGPLRQEIVGLRDQYEGLWTEAVDQGVAQEIFRVRDAKLARLGLLEMCNGVSRWFKPIGRSDVVRISTSFADLALGGLRAQRDGKALSVTDLSLPPSDMLIDLLEGVLDSPDVNESSEVLA